MAAPAAPPRIVISVDGATLRLERGPRRGRRVFPIGVGRVEGKGRTLSPVGTWRTGTDPGDISFYLEHRRQPAFHRGLPFLRLAISRADGVRGVVHPFGIHGPITPTLIWGRVSAGCIRMGAPDIRELFHFARKHPGMEVRIIRGADRVGRRRVVPQPRGKAVAGCPEAALGVRRLRRIALMGGAIHDRICGGVDHWYAIRLEGGDVISVRLRHRGGLKLELYGIRAISTVARGRAGFDYRVPRAHANRGNRYIRVVAPSGKRSIPYSLEVSSR